MDANSLKTKLRGLYAIVDDVAHASYGFAKLLEQIVCESEIPILQLRFKKSDSAQKTNWVKRACKLKTFRDYILIINDDVSYLSYDGVDGAHVGQNDGDFVALRSQFPRHILGLSTHSWEQAQQAELLLADYIGCGAVFATQNKITATPISTHDLQRIGHTIHIPKIAIGGINATNMQYPLQMGCNMVAMISALTKNGRFVGSEYHQTLCHTPQPKVS